MQEDDFRKRSVSVKTLQVEENMEDSGMGQRRGDQQEPDCAGPRKP